MNAKVTEMATFEVQITNLMQDLNSVMGSALNIRSDKVLLEAGRAARAICFIICVPSQLIYFIAIHIEKNWKSCARFENCEIDIAVNIARHGVFAS